MTPYTIGAVIVAKVGARWGEGFVGEERMSALRVFYSTGRPPDGVDIFVLKPKRSVGWHEIRWDTAGKAVTGI